MSFILYLLNKCVYVLVFTFPKGHVKTHLPVKSLPGGCVCGGRRDTRATTADKNVRKWTWWDTHNLGTREVEAAGYLQVQSQALSWRHNNTNQTIRNARKPLGERSQTEQQELPDQCEEVPTDETSEGHRLTVCAQCPNPTQQVQSLLLHYCLSGSVNRNL